VPFCETGTVIRSDFGGGSVIFVPTLKMLLFVFGGRLGAKAFASESEIGVERGGLLVDLVRTAWRWPG
jgi:hypothetical protein